MLLVMMQEIEGTFLVAQYIGIPINFQEELGIVTF